MSNGESSLGKTEVGHKEESGFFEGREVAPLVKQFLVEAGGVAKTLGETIDGQRHGDDTLSRRYEVMLGLLREIPRSANVDPQRSGSNIAENALRAVTADNGDWAKTWGVFAAQAASLGEILTKARAALGSAAATDRSRMEVIDTLARQLRIIGPDADDLKRFFEGSDSPVLSAQREIKLEANYVEGVSRNANVTDNDRATAAKTLEPLGDFKDLFDDWLNQARERYNQMNRRLPEACRSAADLYGRVENQWRSQKE